MPRAASLCVYCGAQAEIDSGYLALARALGAALGRAGMVTVYGGGGTGMMGALADGALDEGGGVIGIVPRGIARLEALHKGSVDLRMVDTMHARKLAMFELGDSVAVLPGGIGTLDEFFEVLTWKGLGIHAKPIYVLNAQGYWDELLAMLDRLVERGFARKNLRELFMVMESVPALMSALEEGGGA